MVFENFEFMSHSNFHIHYASTIFFVDRAKLLTLLMGLIILSSLIYESLDLDSPTNICLQVPIFIQYCISVHNHCFNPSKQCRL